jgi:hypothetical protein
MGIDIYASWRDQSEAEASEQVTGFSAVAGKVGYLREAYHGGPYVTKYLVAEAFASQDGEAAIPARTLRERLPAAVLMHLYREQKLYGNGKDPSRLEDIAALKAALANISTSEVGDASHIDFVAALLPESIETAKRLIVTGMLSDTARALVDFVALCERKERQTGQPCTITASY